MRLPCTQSVSEGKALQASSPEVLRATIVAALGPWVSTALPCPRKPQNSPFCSLAGQGKKGLGSEQRSKFVRRRHPEKAPFCSFCSFLLSGSHVLKALAVLGITTVSVVIAQTCAYAG